MTIKIEASQIEKLDGLYYRTITITHDHMAITFEESSAFREDLKMNLKIIDHDKTER